MLFTVGLDLRIARTSGVIIEKRVLSTVPTWRAPKVVKSIAGSVGPRTFLGVSLGAKQTSKGQSTQGPLCSDEDLNSEDLFGGTSQQR